ncbi:hypothetical protein DFH94DRAFT_716122 [Russula ochroleuca]|jgi:hypothetical protein|uniref:Transmembrane protein n=1 Tax=Russula ochroleuca TaxID=152965 RepID=A0A9P5N2N4_9AGAM|nr:hypothetical protein DFH94DRAFT_716122 [Russula ochroleuca]
MPGPVIYVAVAISAVAAVIVFKEFVYEPHFRPRYSAWKESRQRRKTRPNLHTATPSSPSSHEGDDGSRLSQRSTRGKKKPFRRSAESSATPHIDLQQLIASEVESLRSGVETDGDNSGIRLRRVGESQKRRDRPVGNYARSLDTDSTQSLISLDDSNASDEIPTSGPKNGLSEPFNLSSPTPLSAGMHMQNSIQVVQQGDSSRLGDTPLPPDIRGSLNQQTTVLVGIPHIPETSPISGPVNSLTLMAFGETENTRSSSPDTDFISPSDILSGDQYLTPHDQSLSPQRVHGVVSPTLSSNLSVEFLSSAPISPPGSPFIDAGMYFELVESRRGAAAQQREITSGGAGPSSPEIGDGTTSPSAVILPVVRGDSEIFSLPSQASSDVSSDEGDYDCASILESELSNWTSDIADGERAA